MLVTQACNLLEIDYNECYYPDIFESLHKIRVRDPYPQLPRQHACLYRHLSGKKLYSLMTMVERVMTTGRTALCLGNKKKSPSDDESPFPFPFHLQRPSETDSSSTRTKRFIDSLPPHFTLIPSLAVMEEHKLDYRFFADEGLHEDDPMPCL